ncbi:hypothetical protein LSTR_LSTR013181 [Laodelphax striatellus]|uniref:Uncharacterized protein n=1 Tax=Laodelphax striatellus TaxID=195883 RepID=A0A482WGM1_LAOST|nr:hypothetical protein LSTR_LSTR013181 [Laodelphax striatellus]
MLCHFSASDSPFSIAITSLCKSRAAAWDTASQHRPDVSKIPPKKTIAGYARQKALGLKNAQQQHYAMPRCAALFIQTKEVKEEEEEEEGEEMRDGNW